MDIPEPSPYSLHLDLGTEWDMFKKLAGASFLCPSATLLSGRLSQAKTFSDVKLVFPAVDPDNIYFYEKFQALDSTGKNIYEDGIPGSFVTHDFSVFMWANGVFFVEAPMPGTQSHPDISDRFVVSEDLQKVTANDSECIRNP